MATLEQIKAKQEQRVIELESYGLYAVPGRFQGEISLSATDVEKLLRLLRKLPKHPSARELSDQMVQRIKDEDTQ